ncbi:MAG: hypothetical protein Q8O29_12470 [Polaromonas sp.]|uniref:hypothetical protein n=1 Tax=Polaromonas sp. TaxID=1869339 RepID=UPI0027375348|nr:hypothetical protein [Polaromonas sp.]MDP2819060.1 hypothetical protein [Polaromonas sp.]
MALVPVIEDDDDIRGNNVRLLKLEGFDTLAATEANRLMARTRWYLAPRPTTC